MAVLQISALAAGLTAALVVLAVLLQQINNAGRKFETADFSTAVFAFTLDYLNLPALLKLKYQ